MARKVEKLQEQMLADLNTFQTKSNECVVNLGQIHLKLREIEKEKEKFESMKVEFEGSFDQAQKVLNALLEDLNKKYPNGEVDLIEGTVTFEID